MRIAALKSNALISQLQRVSLICKETLRLLSRLFKVKQGQATNYGY